MARKSGWMHGLMGLTCWILVTMAPGAEAEKAVRATDFLDSIGANSAIDRRGENLADTIKCTRYLGLRWFRSGYEGNPALADLIELHKQTGARFSWGTLSGGTDLTKLLDTGRQLAAENALLAFEGPNEPNNWGFTYNGQVGGKNDTWMPVAALQRDLYRMVKSDPLLKKYPVWGISENGAEKDNVGLQFLTIPVGTNCLMPDGTRYADYANVHNYIYHPNSPKVEDNKTWNAADPTAACKVDGLYGEYGLTWRGHFKGYSEADLRTLPRVTTETGVVIEGAVTEDIHALNLLTLYLDQFKRGWRYTAVYLMRDRVDEGGNQKFGFYAPDYTPRRAAHYLHNLTTILADTPPADGGNGRTPGQLDYTISNQPATMHDLLLQRNDGDFMLVIWNERVQGSDTVSVQLGTSFASARVYDPAISTIPNQAHQNTQQLTLTLTDHPVIIHLSRRPVR